MPSRTSPSAPTPVAVDLIVDGRPVSIEADGATLLDVLREHLAFRGPKDGCSPQGQCGCCTVLVDGAPRVACVTPVRRVAGRTITTVDGLAAEDRAAWGEAFCATGASQCGFCTPGIIVRLQGALDKGADLGDRAAVDQALAAHLCRCTGWQTIAEACSARVAIGPGAAPAPDPDRDLEAAGRRATIEGRAPQIVGTDVALGHGGFADDTAPLDALVAVPDGAGGWAIGETLGEARAAAGKVQGRRTTFDAAPPIELPGGEWVLTLRTSWLEPAYLETDASWCDPSGEPASPLANGGAFGAKRSSIAPAAARQLADRHGRPVRVVLSREDTVRWGPKRPPMAIGLRADGTGLVRVARTAGIADALRAADDRFVVEEVDIPGPPTSIDLRGAGWLELAVIRAAGEARAATPSDRVVTAVVDPEGGRAEVEVGPDGSIAVRVDAGDPLDAVVLRSYVIGAVHQALSWVTSEALAVDGEGVVHDLTIRSFGILRASAMPPVHVEIAAGGGPPVNGSDAVLAATAAAVWVRQGCPPQWPTRVTSITAEGRSRG